MPPGFTASTPAWIVGSSRGTRTVSEKLAGGCSISGVTDPVPPGSGTSPTATVPIIPAPGLPWYRQ